MRKSLCMVLILLICFTTLSPFTYADNETEDGNNTNNNVDLQTQRNDLQNKLDEANGELENVQSDLSENLQQVEKLDKRIEEEQTKLDEQESKIIKLKKSISEVEERLEEISEKYTKQRRLFKDRLVEIYEAGETRYLDILLKSKSLSDFLSSYYIITEMARLDEDVIDELSEKKKAIEQSKQRLENERRELAVIAENQIRLARTLENTKKMRESFIEQLSDEEKLLQEKIDEINKQYEEVNRQILALAVGSIDSKYIGGQLAWPVPGYTRITSEFKMRVHPITGQYKLHTGVDIGAPEGSSFIAANDGTVVKAEYNTAYGNMVVIDHGGGISTLYAHGSSIEVQVGQQVKRGDTVLKVGSTGYSTGSHAHFEVRINGIATDPMPYITTGLVPGSEEDTNTVNNTNTNQE